MSQFTPQKLRLFAIALIGTIGAASSARAASLDQANVATKTEPFFKSCSVKDMRKISPLAKNRKAIAEYRNKNACNQDVMVVPRIGYLGEVQESADWILLKDYARGVGNTQLTVLKKQDEVLKGNLACLIALGGSWDASPSEDCKNRIRYFKEILLPEIGPFRKRLAFSQPPQLGSGLNGDINAAKPERHINLELLGIPATILDTRRSAADEDEAAAIVGEWKNELRAIRERFLKSVTATLEINEENEVPARTIAEQKRLIEEFKRHADLDVYEMPWPAWKAFAKNELVKFREKNRSELADQVEQFRILAKVKSLSPQPQEVAEILRGMITIKKSEIDETETALSEVAKPETDSKVSDAILKLTSYPAYNAMFLKDQKEFCSAAESLEIYRDESATNQAIVRGFAITATSFVMPWMIPAGLARGTFVVASTFAPSIYVIDSLNDRFDEKSKSALSYTVNDERRPTRHTSSDAGFAGDILKMYWASLPIQALTIRAQMGLYK